MFIVLCLNVALEGARGEEEKNLGVQFAENPAMLVTKTSPPSGAPDIDEFEVRAAFVLISTLDEFRATIKKDGQKVRLKPGVYRAMKADPPLEGQEHVFAVNGSNNYFDLRGVIIETPVSLQSRLTGKAHVADTWHINGSGNTFEGGYFRNIVDRDYPNYRVTENEFEIRGDGNTFLDCTFFVRGSIPYGYSDYYGKGGPNFGRLNKHSFMSIERAKNTRLIGCKTFLQSFGHCVHFHGADGVLIKDCHFTGALRPTNDIFKEKVGRAREYGFHIMYRGKRPIPRGQIIPLTEDGVRSYGGDKNITITDTTVERMRGCFQLLCEGDVTLENVTVLEAGDFSFDLSSGEKGRVRMKNCRGDVAYSPLFNLTRGAVPKNAFYEVTILSPAEGVEPTARTSLGTICGDNCTFILRDGTTRPLPAKFNRLVCGGKKRLINSTVLNFTSANLVLTERVRNCVVKSAGQVEDHGQQNTIIEIDLPKDVVEQEPLCEIWDEDVPVMGHLAVALDGSVLVFKEQREKGVIEVKRSEDGGKSWGEPIAVGKRVKIGGDMSDDGRYQGEHVGWSELGNVTVDESTGDIMVFAGSLKPAQVLYRSCDHGKSWRQEQIVIKPDENGWQGTTYCCDPGITLRYGEKKERLLMPAQVFVGSVNKDGSRTYLNKGQNRRYFAKRYSNALYSDDGGKTWTPSAPFPILGTSEPGLVELRDGRIYYNARTHVRPGSKIVGHSEDGGETWVDAHEDDELFDGPPDVYGCKTALARLPYDDRDVLVFSAPGRRDKRHDITIWVSFDGGQSWPVSRLVKQGPGNYTWLAAGRRGTPSESMIYLLANKDWMARFNLAWVLEDQLVSAGGM